MTRNTTPEEANDFPHELAETPDRWVIWANNGKFWPDGERNLVFLSHNTQILRDFALFSDRERAAVTFASKADAIEFLQANTKLRKTTYEVEVSTIQDMIDANFTVGKQRVSRSQGDLGGIWFYEEDTEWVMHEMLPLYWVDHTMKVWLKRCRAEGGEGLTDYGVIEVECQTLDMGALPYNEPFKLVLSQHINRFVSADHLAPWKQRHQLPTDIYFDVALSRFDT